MCKVIENITKSDNAFSIEVVPPSRGSDIRSVIDCVQSIGAYGPAFVSVTDHPAGHVWIEHDGIPKAVSIRSKPGTFGLCVTLRETCGTHVVPHVVCVSNDRFRAEDELIDLRYAGFRDLFVIRGDERFLPFVAAPKIDVAASSGMPGNRAGSRGGDFPHACDMLDFIGQLNDGSYSGGAIHGEGTGFYVGVAGYPEKHPSALNRESDMGALLRKVKAGARWIITQMVLDAGVYEDFVRRARSAGIEIPIIPGIKPITRKASLAALPGNFFINVPQDLARAMEDARTPAEERRVGIESTAALVGKLYDAGAPCVHMFTMDKARDTLELLSAVFGPAGTKRIRI